MRRNTKRLKAKILRLQSERKSHIDNNRPLSAQLVEAQLTRIRSNIETAIQDKAS